MLTHNKPSASSRAQNHTNFLQLEHHIKFLRRCGLTPVSVSDDTIRKSVNKTTSLHCSFPFPPGLPAVSGISPPFRNSFQLKRRRIHFGVRCLIRSEIMSDLWNVAWSWKLIPLVRDFSKWVAVETSTSFQSNEWPRICRNVPRCHLNDTFSVCWMCFKRYEKFAAFYCWLLIKSAIEKTKG